MDATGRGDLLGVCGFQFNNCVRLAVHMGVGQADAIRFRVTDGVNCVAVVAFRHRFLTIQGQVSAEGIFTFLIAQFQKCTILRPI